MGSVAHALTSPLLMIGFLQRDVRTSLGRATFGRTATIATGHRSPTNIQWERRRMSSATTRWGWAHRSHQRSNVRREESGNRRAVSRPTPVRQTRPTRSIRLDLKRVRKQILADALLFHRCDIIVASLILRLLSSSASQTWWS